VFVKGKGGRPRFRHIDHFNSVAFKPGDGAADVRRKASPRMVSALSCI